MAFMNPAYLSAPLAVLEGAHSLDDALESLLRGAVDAFTAGSTGRGDAQGRRRVRDRIEDALTRWLEPAAARALAHYLVTLLQGLAAQARDGATSDDLELVATEALAGLRAREIIPTRSSRVVSTKYRRRRG